MEKTEEPMLDCSNHSQLLQKNCRFYYQLSLSIVASLLPFVNGCITGSLSTINNKIEQERLPFPTTKDDVTTITNMASWSIILGPMIFTYFINHYGRQKTMLLLLILPTIHFIFLYFANDVRIVTLAVCLAFVPSLVLPAVVGVYISEVTAPHLRGSMNNLVVTSYCAGITISSIITWPLTLSLGSIILFLICVCIWILVFFLPESPYFFIRNNQPLHAKKVLRALYNEEVSNLELTRLSRHIDQASVNSTGLKTIISQSKYRRGVLLIFNLFFSKFGSAALIFDWFCPMLLSQGKYEYLSPYLGTNIIFITGTFLCVMNSVSLRYFYIKSIGIFSFTFTGVTLAMLSIYYYLIEHDCEFLINLPDFLPFSLFFLFKASVSLGLLALPYIYLRELIQVEVLAYSSFLVDFFVPIAKVFTVFCFNFLRTQYGYSAAFGFCFSCVLLNGVIFVVFTPETKNKVIEDAQMELEK